MRLRRRLPILIGVLLIAAAVAIVVVMRKHAPPEAARLLPSADGFLYVNLRGLRHAKLPVKLPPVSHDPEYEQFIGATGFQFESDLQEAAFAVHYPVRPGGQLRYTEVLVGKIQGQRLRDYLKKMAASVENYYAIDIYSIPIEDRTLRVAIIGVDTVAASNHSDPEIIRRIVERSRKLASPFAGPSLLRKYYQKIPFTYVPYASLCWSVFRVDPAAQGPAAGPAGVSFLFTHPAVVVASVYYLRGIKFRADAYTDDEEEAKRVTEQLNTFLAIFHSAEASVGKQGPDHDVQELFNSLKVSRDGERAVLTATVPPGFIEKIFKEPTDSKTLNPLTPPEPEKPPKVTPR